MATTTEPLTLEAYAALTEPENEYVTELVRGAVVREPRPGSLHGRVQFELAWRLRNWVEQSGRGEVLGESGFILSDDPATVRGPDVAVLLPGRGREVGPAGWIRGAPDVAVEVLSPSDMSTAIQAKVVEYLEGGAALVWVVEPTARTVTVYRPDGSASLLRECDALNGEEVLPGLTLPLEKLFGG